MNKCSKINKINSLLFLIMVFNLICPSKKRNSRVIFFCFNCFVTYLPTQLTMFSRLSRSLVSVKKMS